MRDINFLQGCLDDEATFRAESVGTLTREPTLTGREFIHRNKMPTFSKPSKIYYLSTQNKVKDLKLLILHT